MKRLHYVSALIRVLFRSCLFRFIGFVVNPFGVHIMVEYGQTYDELESINLIKVDPTSMSINEPH